MSTTETFLPFPFCQSSASVCTCGTFTS